MPSAAVSAHGPFAWASPSSGVVPPRCALGGYCTGAPVPMTGDLGNLSGRLWRTSGYRARASRLPASTFLSTGPFGLVAAIGASRPSRASVRVPFVYTSEMRGASIVLLSGKFRRPAFAEPG